MSSEEREFPREMQPRYDEVDVARILRVSVRTVQAWRLRRTGPSFVRIGTHVRYTERALLDYIEARTEKHE
ncbi:helix-turn-helix domain-containing protein [Microbacterium sp. NPDC096154]|uniref:helix-turn-helix domain-containing protein n=1 Tax=Microbacterium sp. NPDC096154 TaxID=3155549 RepID=UPI00332AAF5D